MEPPMLRPPIHPTPLFAAESDDLYFARRSEEEERAAANARDEKSALVHRTLAGKYAALAALARRSSAKAAGTEESG